MKQKSLRQLAKELGVSHSYLSQVKHGKRPASDKVQEALDMVSMVSNTEARVGTSTPLGGINSVFGGFDSHALPPVIHPLTTHPLT
ncbi:multiprotein-bridging factor 1 family protein [Chloroflexota bacterium]